MFLQITTQLILAGLAIFFLYIFSPLLKEVLRGFFSGNKKKRNVSKREFDEMIERKKELLLGRSDIQNTQSSSSSKIKKRVKWDYIVENNLIEESQKEQVIKLFESLSWGIPEELKQKHEEIKKVFIPISSDDLFTSLKSLINSEEIISLAKIEKISLERIYQYLFLDSGLKSLNQDETVEVMAKRFNISKEITPVLINLSLHRDDKKKSLKSIEQYINAKKVKVDDTKTSTLIKSGLNLKTLLAKLEGEVSTIMPLDALDPELKYKKYTQEKSKEELKKSYKKLIAIYHPDKWTYFDKSDAIDERLRENFNNVKKYFDKEIGKL